MKIRILLSTTVLIIELLLYSCGSEQNQTPARNDSNQSTMQTQNGDKPANATQSTAAQTKSGAQDSPERKVLQNVEDLDALPSVTKQIAPKYPEAASKKGVQGTVMVKALIDEKGKVEEVRIIKNETNSKELETAATDAVKQWEFKPATMKGKSVSFWVAVPIRFRLK